MSYWQQKTALVTGGSSGLGLAVASELARQGARVALVARDAARLETAAKQLGPKVFPIPADITRDDDVARMMAATLEKFGRLEMLVNCAGRSARGEAIETTPEQFQEFLELNFLALVRCTRAAAPHLLASGGHLVNIGSLAAKSAARFLGAYPASKFPVAAYSQQLRLELGPKGLHVLLVCPGPIAREAPRIYAGSENLPPEARQPGGGVKVKGIPPQQLAQQILRACERRQPELVIPAKARLLFAISQLSPAWGDWLLGRFT